MAKPQTTSRVVKKIPSRQNNIAQSTGIDTVFSISVGYVDDTGKIQIPLAEGNECRIVQTSQKISRKVVSWVAERIGDIPDLPDPDTGDSNDEIDSQTIMPVSVNYMPDGKTKIYAITGQYVYLLKKPVEKINIPKSPIGREFGQEYVKSNKFKKLI